MHIETAHLFHGIPATFTELWYCLVHMGMNIRWGGGRKKHEKFEDTCFVEILVI
jgi:hypothetical protein